MDLHVLDNRLLDLLMILAVVEPIALQRLGAKGQSVNSRLIRFFFLFFVLLCNFVPA